MGKDNNYKDTLNLPRTSFEMKASLLTKEPAIQARWKSQDLYGRIRQERDGARRFILHDGPPFANGNIHLGHALNKVLKDLVVRIKTMEGFDAPFVPGWDCHGQPIEQKIVDELGFERVGAMGPMEIRRRCRDYAARFVELQSQQFQRLGVLGDFPSPYITMSPQYEADVLEIFARLVEQGLVYRQLKPVHWSIENRTALADAELEYHDRQDPSIYVGFRLAGDMAEAMKPQAGPLPECMSRPHKAYLLIWTTTPWTLPANLAVAIHPKFEYCCVHAETADGDMLLVLAERRVQAVMEAIKSARGDWLKSYSVIATHLGWQVLQKNLMYWHPLAADKACPVVAADYVTLEDGTGLVHTAPGHGLEDYGTALKNNLAVYCPVQADGTFDDSVPQWLAGMNVWKANPRIVDRLREDGTLLLEQAITHSYPHDWRSRTPTIFRATEQWFIAVDRRMPSGQSLRELAMEACRRDVEEGGVRFVPAWGRNRIAGMLESRPDWCISRQRAWGLPIPAFYDRNGSALMTPSSIRAAIRTIAAAGSDAWFTMSPRQLLDGYDPADDKSLPRPESFALDELTAGQDILDVWFESGSSWFAAAVRRNLVEDIPVDMYLEGSDQHRGWFQLSLLPALGARGSAPFKTVLTHGWVLDEEGRKMSKSLGNTIDVIEELNNRGADIIRLWAATQNYQDDVHCSGNLLAQAEDAYRKIRNTLRFCMGACFDFDPARHATEPADHSVDRWMRLRLHELIRDVRQAFDRYEFYRATRMIYEFCTVEASAIYMSAVKDRLYCESPDATRRRATQTVIHEMLVALTKLLAPILVHTAEEAWQHIPSRDASEPDSVHLAALPDYDKQFLQLADDLRPVNPDLGAFSADQLQVGPAWIWDHLLDLRQAGLVKLEALRNAGVKNPLDAEAVFKVRSDNEALAQTLEIYIREMEDLLGVGYARVERTADLPEGLAVDVEVADSRDKFKRCARSWKRRPDVGSDAQYPDLSARDAIVMKELGARG